MTTIKPPNGNISPPAGSPAGPSEPGSAPAPAAQSQASQAAESVSGQAPASLDAIGQLAADLRAGKLDMDQAVEQLVQRAVANAPQHVDAAEREQLAVMMRQALAMDPTLLALQEP